MYMCHVHKNMVLPAKATEANRNTDLNGASSIRPFPEHYPRLPRYKSSADEEIARVCRLLQSHVVLGDNMGQHGLQFVRCEEPTWACMTAMSESDKVGLQ